MKKKEDGEGEGERGGVSFRTLCGFAVVCVERQSNWGIVFLAVGRARNNLNKKVLAFTIPCRRVTMPISTSTPSIPCSIHMTPVCNIQRGNIPHQCLLSISLSLHLSICASFVVILQ